MRITPLDIHHKKFRTALRGYNEEEVDSFLDEIAAELDRALKENTTLKEQSEQSKEKMTEYQTMEQTLHHALLNAQRLADEITEKTQKEADKDLREAKKEAARIFDEAVDQRKELLASIKRLRKVEAQYKEKLLDILNQTVKEISESEELVDEKVMQLEDEISKKLETFLPEEEEAQVDIYGLEGIEPQIEMPEPAQESQPEVEAGGEGEEAEVPPAEEEVQPELENVPATDESEEAGKPPEQTENILDKKDYSNETSFSDLGEGVPGVLGRRRAKRKSE